jgi:hypothetical protein
MTLLLSRVVLSRHSRSIHLVRRKLFSSDAAASSTSTPLFLSLPETPYYDKGPRILFPSNVPIIPVSSIADIQSAVEEHYELGGGSQQFVGGMGESDGGVWFVPTAQNSDPLHHYTELIEPSIDLVKQSRHGVPFGICTSGTVLLDPEKTASLKKSFAIVHVSLLAANPMDYCEAAGIFREELFGDVCNFLVAAEEHGVPIHVGVLKKFSSDGRDLAIALGAQHVIVYDS